MGWIPVSSAQLRARLVVDAASEMYTAKRRHSTANVGKLLHDLGLEVPGEDEDEVLPSLFDLGPLRKAQF